MVRRLGTASQTVAVASQAATPIVEIAAAHSVATILSVSAATAVPIIGVAILGVTLAIEKLLNSGCGRACIVTSNWANQAEQLLQQNIAAYFALPAPRTAAQRAAGLANFDAIWNYLAQQCAQVPGDPGRNCTADRQAGACKWKAQPPAYPGEPAAGACWNWFNAYRDPIAADQVSSDAVTTELLNAGVSPGFLETAGPYLLPAALIVAAVVLL